jgi:hypothetical protein
MTISPESVYFQITSHDGVKILHLFDRETKKPIEVGQAGHIQGLPEGFIPVPNFENPDAIAYATQAQDAFSLMADAGFEEAPSSIFTSP